MFIPNINGKAATKITYNVIKNESTDLNSIPKNLNLLSFIIFPQ